MTGELNNSVIKADDHDIIYALRTAHQNQMQLNLMADQKANILVGTIVIFLSFLVTRYNSIDFSNKTLILILSTIVIAEFVAIFIGIMVIKPRTNWTNAKLKIDQMPNPLFFGFFTNFSEQVFVEYMQQKLTDNKSARDLLLKDIYQIGVVLKRKFTLLKYAYSFASAGIFLGVVSFTANLILGNS